MKVSQTSKSMAAQVREWVAAQPPVTLFRTRDLPASGDIARPVMAQLVKDEDARVVRLLPGVYVKDVPPGSEVRSFRNFTSDWRVGVLLGGLGSGIAGYRCMLLWGLNTQVPSGYTTIAAPYPHLPAPDKLNGLRFERRYNLLRRELTWAEASLLEMVVGFDQWSDVQSAFGTWHDAPWEDSECWKKTLEEFDTRRAIMSFTLQTSSSGLELLIRRDKFAEVALAEKRRPPVFYERVRSLVEVLPQITDHETWNNEGTYRGYPELSYPTDEVDEEGLPVYVDLKLDIDGKCNGVTPRWPHLVWATP